MRQPKRSLGILGLILLVGSAFLVSFAQDQTPPPSQTVAPENASQPYQTETPEQLQRLVAPIALYPDDLVASILAACSFPSQIAAANDWLAPRKTLFPQDLASEADKQTWDPSVKSLLPFPPVLQNLAANLSWTSELGDAYYNQASDAMNAIQAMRRQAKKSGNLKSNDQIKVKDSHGYITIEPSDPKADTVYVPAYDPWLVYGYPIEPWPEWVPVPGIWWDGPGIYFGGGFFVEPFLGFGWGWGNWGFDWGHRGLLWGGVPYWRRGPEFFDRGGYYGGHPGFYRNDPFDTRSLRGYSGPRSTGPRFAPGTRSGPFSGFDHGGTTRGFSARGQGSFGGGGFRGGGFGGGGFHGGGRH